jgi:hypothetical protein
MDSMQALLSREMALDSQVPPSPTPHITTVNDETSTTDGVDELFENMDTEQDDEFGLPEADVLPYYTTTTRTTKELHGVKSVCFLFFLKITDFRRSTHT